MTAPAFCRRPSARDVARALIDLIWSSVILVAIPVGLATVFGSPLPSQLPDLSEITTTPLQLVDPQVLTNVLVCIGWLIWAAIVAYVVIDGIDVARGVGRRVRRVWPGSVVAGKFVASLVVLFALLRPSGAPASALARPIAVTATFAHVSPTANSVKVTLPTAASSSGSTSSATTAPASASPARTYTVQRNDTLWDIAERFLDDPFRWAEIQDLNADQLTSPAGERQLMPGSVIRLPDDKPTAAPNERYVVEPGDSLWEIAADELGDPARWPEIESVNDEIIDDPGAIEPGWELTLPAPSATTAPPTVPAPAAEQPPAPKPSALVSPAAPPTTVVAPPTPSWAPSTTTATTVPLWVQARGFDTLEEFEAWARQNPDQAREATTPEAGAASTATGWALRGAIPVLVAAAAALTLTRRRQRVLARRPPKAPALRRDPDLVPTELSLRQLVEDDASVKVRMLDTVLRALNTPPVTSGRLCLARPTDTDIELLWSIPPAGAVPAGFIVEDAGYSWRLPIDEAIDDLERQAAGRVALVPALVTVGDTTAGPALANLAAITPLAVTGDPDAITRWLAGINVEIAAQPWSERVRYQPQRAQTTGGMLVDVCIDPEADVLTITSEPLGEHHSVAWQLELQTDRARLASADERFDLALTPVGIDPDDADRLSRLLVEATVDPYHQPLTVIVEAPVAVDHRPDTIEAPTAAVAAAKAEDVDHVHHASELAAAAGIELPAPPVFGDQNPVPSSTSPADREGDSSLVQPDPPEPASVGTELVDEEAPRPPATVVRNTSETLALSAPALWEPRIGLRVLGRPSVAGALMNVQPKPMALLSFLALSRPDRPHRNQIINTVWGGDVNGRKNMNTAITRVRKAFGDDNLITVDAGGHYSITGDLDSDWEQFQRLVRRAATVAGTTRFGLLRDALALVQGAPFADCDDKTFGWVGAELRSRMEIAIHDNADLLASEAVEAGHGQLAVWAARQGLKGCPYVTGLFRYIFHGLALQGDHASFEAVWREVQANDDLVPVEVVHTYRDLRTKLVGS